VIWVGHVVHELGEEPIGVVWVVDGVDAPGGLLGVPGESDLAAALIQAVEAAAVRPATTSSS
jgi:hypothetical protein